MSFLRKLLRINTGASLGDNSQDEQKKPSDSSKKEFNLSLASHIPEQYLPLWQLYKQRQLLEVRIGSASRVYQSMIIALDIERGLLWLDDLFPQQRVLDVGDELFIRHHRQGEQLLIRAPIIALGTHFGASGIAILLPEENTYRPRRSNPRFNLTSDSPIMVKIRTLGEEPCFGTLQDISAGGVRIHVAGNLLAHLRHGTQLPLCEIDLGDNLLIRCRARVCSARIARSPHRCTQISLEFIDLPERKCELLMQFLQRAQRDTSARFQAA